MKTAVFLVFFLAIVFNALANILIKASTLRKGTDIYSSVNGFMSEMLNPYFVGGLISFGLALLAYRYVLGNGIKLSVGYPIMTTAGFAIVIFASKIFFNETLYPVQWVGIAFLAVGLWLVASRLSV